MRISDWSSDVCSSDLRHRPGYPRQKMKRKPAIADDDTKLFRSAIGPVRPLPESVAAPRQPPPKPVPRMRQRDEAEAIAASHTPDPALAQMLADGMLAWRRPHVSTRGRSEEPTSE